VDDVEILKNIYIFSSFSLENLGQIQRMAVEEKFKKGQVVFWEGARPQWLFILKKGKAKIFKQSKSGKETIIRIVDAGEPFDELSVIDGRPYSASAKIMEASTVLKIPRLEFLRMVRKYPEVSFEVILDLCERLRGAQDLIQELAVERVEKRIVTLLLKLSDRIGLAEGDKVRIPMTLTRQDIADMVGSTVETAIRIVSRLTREGLIETKGKSITIRNLEGLKALPEDLF